MDRQLLERMVGATVLIVALIVIVPAVLDGPGDEGSGDALRLEPSRGEELRTVTITADVDDGPPVATTAAPAPEIEPEPEPDTAAAAAPAVEPKPQPKPQPAPKAEAKTQPEPAAQPKPEPAQVAKSAVADGWAVQLGSFSNRENAERLAARVSDKGFRSYLEPLQRDGKTLYRVRVGPESSRADAEALAKRLSGAGFKGQLARQEASS